ncbi:MAG: hypothetical protein ACI825_000368 [Planctomycetota bacterium]|jgi:hypothetical protein|uniref:DUF6029 family protein n=1 Tax=Patiriisocius sp. Uisw_047 TaxID=3230969 RepID=UPI0039E8918E
MKKIIFGFAILYSGLFFAQEQDKGYFFGGFESNYQWLLEDEGINFLPGDDNFRANNYFQLNYNYGNFTAGVQHESYLPAALLGYSPVYDNNNGIAHYYLNYKNDGLDITGGYFYEQFGSGLILRSWEDRQLGINNAIRGVRIKYAFTDYLDFTALYGQQRNGFALSDGVVQGLDANIDLSTALAIETVDLRLGASYVNRYQDTGIEEYLPGNVNAVSGRLDFVKDNVYGGVEVVSRSKDALFIEGLPVSQKLYDATAMQVNLGYAQKGLGINSSFRRLENFSFYADREAQGNVFNEQILNYVPALTKQQDYLLTNIYVYNAQPGLNIDNVDQKAGEVGSQTDIYYSIKKGSTLGGKYGTKIAANFSYWAGLDATYNVPNRFYEAKFVGSGPRLFRDFNLEVKKRWTKGFSSVFTFQDVIIDKGVAQPGPLGQGDISAQIAVFEGTFRLKDSKSLRFVTQHLWSEDDRKNWVAGVVEYNFNSRINIYALDSYNYGNEDEVVGKVHYYSVGGSYSKGRTRLSFNYGRQRGGLICVGGVCREVPESNGLSGSINVSF